MIPFILSSDGLWMFVEDIVFTLVSLGYMAPEQCPPSPSWPRVASANVELEVVRDALEQDPGLDGRVTRSRGKPPGESMLGFIARSEANVPDVRRGGTTRRGTTSARRSPDI